MMTASSVVLALVVAFGSAPADTTWAVGSGDRLSLENFSGDIRVMTWDRDFVAIQERGNKSAFFDVRSRGNEFRVRPSASMGRRRDDDGRYVVRVPTWLPLEIRGRELDIMVSDHSGGLVLSTLEGDIELEDVRGEIRARSLDGVIAVTNAEGLIDLFSMDDDVRVRGARGELRIDANDGDITLWDIDAEVVEASTVDGDISFEGTLHPDGRYTMVTHDGDITFGIWGEPDAHVLVSTFEGDLESDFPIILSQWKSGGEFDFTLGGGSAEVRLEAFDGAVRVQQARSGTRNRRRDDGIKDGGQYLATR